MVKVLFVCLGNICRSPSAEGVFRKLVTDQGLGEYIQIDSAGTHAYHVGSPPDERARAAALQRGIDMSGLRGRQVDEGDFYLFDYILAMDRDNEYNLQQICPPDHETKLRLFMDYADNWNEREVPDPYYGGHAGFERVLDMIEDAAAGLLEDIRKNHL